MLSFRTDPGFHWENALRSERWGQALIALVKAMGRRPRRRALRSFARRHKVTVERLNRALDLAAVYALAQPLVRRTHSLHLFVDIPVEVFSGADAGSVFYLPPGGWKDTQ